MLHRWRLEPPTVPVGQTMLDESAQLLDLTADNIAAAAIAHLRECPTRTSRSLLAPPPPPLLVGDPIVLTEFLGWLGALRINSGVPPRALEARLDVLAPIHAAHDRRAGRLLSQARSASA